MEGKFDQAQGLRAMQRNSINQVRMQNSRVKVITVTGGKGGVGKSNVSLNLAVALAAQGKKVMLSITPPIRLVNSTSSFEWRKNIGHMYHT